MHSRIHFLRDKAAKTRVIAIGDIYSQSLLKPISRHLYKTLRSFPCDYTFDQEAGRSRVKKETSSGKMMFSLDLRAATDRFPVKFQAESLTRLGLLNRAQIRFWTKLIKNRTFSFRKEKGSKVYSTEYAVGQPMGMHSSWPAMALSHHVLVLYAAHLCG